MRILIAEDDPISRRVLESSLKKWGHETVVTTDGRTACRILQSPDAPSLAVLDWMMPEMDGVDVCRHVRAGIGNFTYIILLTAKGGKEDIIAGLHAGADDYLTKPFDQGELHARLQVGKRILDLQRKLADQVHELQDALNNVKLLQGLLPICSYCKKVRDDKNYWQTVESYVSAHSKARFSHGICPDCWDKEVEPQLRDKETLL